MCVYDLPLGSYWAHNVTKSGSPNNNDNKVNKKVKETDNDRHYVVFNSSLCANTSKHFF